jgi:hypothetical protein
MVTSSAESRRLSRSVQSLSPRAAVLTGGALMVAGQLILVALLLAGAALPRLDASALVVVPSLLAAIVLLWLGPVVVAVAASQPGWIGALAFPGGCAVWAVGTLMTDALADGGVLAAVEGALPVFSFAGALAVVGGGRVWRRLTAVAVVAGLSGATSFLLDGVSGVARVGLVVAVGLLAWMSPGTRPPRTSVAAHATAGPLLSRRCDGCGHRYPRRLPNCPRCKTVPGGRARPQTGEPPRTTWGATG